MVVDNAWHRTVFCILAWTVISLCCTVLLGCRNVVYRADTADRYLEITEVSANGVVLRARAARDTVTGPRSLTRVRGDCEFILETIYGWDHPRLVVETNDPGYYEVVYDYQDPLAFEEVVKHLGCRAVTGRRRVVSWIIEIGDPNAQGLKPYDGKPRWPRLALASLSPQDEMGSHGTFEWPRPIEVSKSVDPRIEGAIYKSDDTIYFDGVSLDDFAVFLERVTRLPTVNRTEKLGRFSFTTEKRFWNELEFDDEPYTIDSLGLDIIWGKPEIEVTVVKKQAAAGLDVEH